MSLAPKVPRRPGATVASQATRASRRKAAQFAEQADLCRVLPCWICQPFRFGEAIERILRGGLPPEHRVSDPDHWKTRGAGGLDEDTLPACRPCHNRLDGVNGGRRTVTEPRGLDPHVALSLVRRAVVKLKESATP